jgi:hypothetical protein
VFLSAHHFDGDPETLAAAHDRLYQRFPAESLDLHVCVLVEDGITVFDACQSREIFTAFSQSAGFRQALAEAGLPQPRLEPLGEVHDARVRDEVAL